MLIDSNISKELLRPENINKIESEITPDKLDIYYGHKNKIKYISSLLVKFNDSDLLRNKEVRHILKKLDVIEGKNILNDESDLTLYDLLEILENLE